YGQFGAPATHCRSCGRKHQLIYLTVVDGCCGFRCDSGTGCIRAASWDVNGVKRCPGHTKVGDRHHLYLCIENGFKRSKKTSSHCMEHARMYKHKDVMMACCRTTLWSDIKRGWVSMWYLQDSTRFGDPNFENTLFQGTSATSLTATLT
ncbi:hypothetical protein PHMEG_00023879, partial [Phytophthora megakarya]